MICPRCAADAPDDATFCPHCGAALKTDAELDAAPTEGGPSTARTDQRRSRMIDEPEHELWKGTYSPKAMLGTWVVLGLLTIVGLVIGALQIQDRWQWGALLGVIALGWLIGFGVLVYRRLGIRYRLTSQRLYHEKGVLRRQIDRIELIRIEDISCEQGVFERMLGIGTVQIKSSDQTDPRFSIRGTENVREVSHQIDQARRAEQVKRRVLLQMD